MFGLVPFRNGGVDRRKDLWDIDSIFENFFNDSVFPAFFANSGQMKVDIKENARNMYWRRIFPAQRKMKSV
jgi:HSP20 family protein